MAHVIVVDDCPVIGRMMQRFLGSIGCKVTIFYSGQSLLDYLNAEDCDEPCFLIVDYMMPGTTGDEVVRQVRLRPATASVPKTIFRFGILLARWTRS